MSGQKMRWVRTALSMAVVLISGLAGAERDTFFLGSGRDSALTVSTAGTVVNRYAQVLAPLAEGDKSISVSPGSEGNFKTGDLIMVLQTTGLVPVPVSGSSETVSLFNSPVGRWELARLESVTAASGSTTLTLTAALVYSYAAQVSQVIRVPEYSTVKIEAGGTIEATPWDGSTGGVIAFLAQGALTNNGKILASGAGFRGGQPTNNPAADLGCEGIDEAAPKGAQKGEGHANVSYGPAHTGIGNVGSAGGGGVCSQSGGGGGSNGGVGGRGGFSNSVKDGARDVGGMPGTLVMVFPVGHLSMGGGGGAGHGVGGTAGGGGRGGGIILIRANSMDGTGSIEADGARGNASTGTDASGGGGGGGTIHLRFASTASCGSVHARGGYGGDSNGGAAYVGTGGGGGGGVVLHQSSGGVCDPDVLGGGNGFKQDNVAYGYAYGAKRGNPGVTEFYTSGYALPSVPTVETPTNNALVTTHTPFVSGKAQSGVVVTIYIDGVAVEQAVASSSGAYSATLSQNVADGAHRIEVAAESLGAWSSRSAASNFTVDATPPAVPVIAAPTQDSWVADTTPTISGTAEPSSKVTVLLNGADVGSPTADAAGNWSFTLAALSETSYTVAARATDAAGNVGPFSPTTRFTVDVTEPETSLDSQPQDPSNTANATFTFSSAETGAVFECALDSDIFTTCISPVSLTLSDGRHTFKVRAQDAAGNVDATPATYTWVLDTGAPDVSITDKPASVTNATSAQFVFVSNDLGSSFECSFDGAAFTSCSSPVNFMGLSEGAHSFKVRAQDVVGNVSAAPASWNWTVDTTAPGAPVITAPTEGQKIEDFSLSITGTAEPGSKVRIFIGATEAGSVTTGGSGNWSFSPTPPLGNGSYTIKATATDAAGNTSPESGARSFVVELKQEQPGGDGNGEEESGCGCAASGFDPAMSVMALAGLAAFVNRRRRRQ